MKISDTSPIAKQLLGFPGRMISHSKSLGPATAVWNAQIVNAEGKAVWAGDIDIEKSREQILQLAKQLGMLYILPESGKSTYDALVMVKQDKIWIDDKFANYIRMKSSRKVLKTKGGTGNRHQNRPNGITQKGE